MKVNRVLIRLIAVVLVSATLAGVWGWRSGSRHTPEEMVQQGLLAVQKQDWPEVLRCANELKRDPKFAKERHLFRGIYYLKTEAAAVALKEFQRLEPVGVIREPALLYAGEALYRLDRILEAEFMFDALAAEHPEHVDAHRWLAGIAHDLGDMNRSMDELKLLIRLEPSDYRPYMLQGQMHVDLELYRDAVDDYARAEALHPPESVLAEILPEMARSQIQIREYTAARETLARAPRSALVSALDAECRLNLGDEPGARLQLEDALERDPELTYALRLLGRLELDAGHPGAALEPLRKVVELDRSDHESQHQLAQALRLTGKISEANDAARQAARTIEINHQLTELLRESIGSPQDADLRERMAKLCDELGKPKLSAMWRKAALVCRQRLSVRQSLLEGSQIPSVL